MPRIIKSSKIGDAAILKQIIQILKKEKLNSKFHFITIKSFKR